MNQALEALKRATKGTSYEGRLYLVGGIVRDKLLGKELSEDADVVLEGDAAELAEFLYECNIADHKPVTYPRFGTAMVSVKGKQIELVGARKESYERNSRKPSTEPSTLLDDVERRDFTINTLLENLHTSEILDLTGCAKQDISNGIIRTPKDPQITFDDDPLRMMRAIRFAVRLGFEIDTKTYAAIRDMSTRLKIVSAERIKDEFIKIIMNGNASKGLEMLWETTLLDQFAPEISSMRGITQNVYHLYDVWTHTMKALDIIPPEAGMIIRLTVLLHDIGKPKTKSVDENGNVHFYNHQTVGAEMAQDILQRLKFSNSVIDKVSFLISMHLRVGEYDSHWSDAAVRRLLRETGDDLGDLILLTKADKESANPEMPSVDVDALKEHINRVEKALKGQKIASPLDGKEIIELLEIEPGPKVGFIKNFLEEQIINGTLLPGDKVSATNLLLKKYKYV